MPQTYHLELYAITVMHSGVLCKFKGNPYQVFIDIPGGVANIGHGRGHEHPKVMFGGIYDPQEVIDLLKAIPMYDRSRTNFVTEDVVVTYSSRYLRRSVEAVPGKSRARRQALVRFNTIPRAYIPPRYSEVLRPAAWLF